MSGLQPAGAAMDPRALREAFGAFPTGVVAVAAEIDGNLVGLAASSFTSVSLDPPLASFAVAKTSATWPELRRGPHVGVTVLAEGHGALARQLAGPAGQRFKGVAVEVSEDGAAMLAGGIVRYDCTVVREIEAGDHLIVLLHLHSVVHGAGRPLVFHRSGFDRVG